MKVWSSLCVNFYQKVRCKLEKPFEARLKDLKDRMREWGIDTALVTDDDNVFYLTGYYDYLHMEFGRPTIFM